MDTKAVQSVDEALDEIMRICRSLPARPVIEDVEAAKALIWNVEREDQARLELIGKQTKSPRVPEELFMVLQEMQKNLVYIQSKEQRREALKLLDLENAHALFDELIQRAYGCLSGSSSNDSSKPTTIFSDGSVSDSTMAGNNSFDGVTVPRASVNKSPATASSSLYYSEKNPVQSSELFTRDDSFVKKAKSSFYTDRIGVGHGVSTSPQILDSTLKSTFTSGQDGDKLSLIKLASLIEVSAKKGTRDLNLEGKLMDQIDWLPDSIGKLSSLVSLNLSENRIVSLPSTIGGLSSLTRLDLHSNKIVELPDSIGDILNLLFLDVRDNQLSCLPATFGRLVRLEELDLSANRLSALPESIGSLVSLKRLIVETNDIEELPHTIGRCLSLKELCADYNRLKALPEAVGKIESLEVLSVRYNNIKQLPTTMASLSNLRELDISFNELESIPESLCFATTLVKMNVGNNFADLRSLPRSIGNLEMLEELDISNNQIRVLPDSFRMLTQLRVLRVEENPLEMPPRHIAEKGAQAVVQYMAELVENRDVKLQPIKQKKSWAQMCFFSKSNKRKRNVLTM
ncbi:plant intracellular Ras-group-related LRR protein 4 [Tripterygium wilfordii]|uniref:Plant intracellular Ras-group-related LRR protein 4 n=1 Tax=Tripterygium wilfordii TaxID=458696 RepID=A0A7J7C9V0_TRIWF|nr:plant intracellular Ras-group-related LRR protein 4-like [Tripterygium wilfordii]XP_038686391.1 plant intracellular Ras-group-related LRR protein 4-like [Tripterygium wilfordii]XP_038686392.1 plant intracellular Ras-group-related LRR protein 4-like [Tripterygium wilfordii]KAF5730705.1 plant intracellular Ras-group-related LRR protein 4 [Tripterygium wilfordii]